MSLLQKASRWLSRGKQTVAAIAIVSMGSFMMFPANAYASGTFSWSATMYYGIASRNWYQNAGTTTITHYLPCSGNGSNTYYIELVKDMLIDKYYARKYYTCGTLHTSKWYRTENGTYKFKLRHYQYTTITANGRVYYQ